jgi:PAS domain S-box-containing protein
VIVAGADGKFLLFNETAQRILGIGPKEVSPSEWSSTYGCYYPDMRTPYPPEQLPLSRALRGLEVRESEVFIRNVNVPGGLWISVNGAPLVEEDGAPAGGVVVFRDITEPRKQREALERLSNAVEKTADTVFITNRDGVIEYVNPAFEATTGYSSAEALGNNPRILKSGKVEAEKYRDLWKNILNGEVYRTTTINRKKSGELYHAEQTITPMKNSEGQVTHFVSVLKDVTENLERQKREIEMHYASMVQKKLYPVESPKLAGFDIEGAVFPAEATCGDYFDYLSMPNRALGIAIGDVCGHGLGPAFIMAETRAYVRSLAKGCSEPNEILDPINEWLHSDLEEASYVTLLLARIDVSARSLVYANAGHTPGYILDRAGRLKAVLDSTGLPLGMFPHSKCAASERLDFVPGDLLVLLTDGITESEGPDGSMFEGDRVLEVIRAHQEEPAEQIVLHVRRAIWDFTQSVKPYDDLTIVVCKALAEE